VAVEVPRQHTVYRFYDADGVPLYVGRTGNLQSRVRTHKQKTWWGDVAALETEVFSGAEEAREAEKREIRRLGPVYNIQMNEHLEVDVDKLRRLRTDKGWSSRKLSELAGGHSNTVWKIENGGGANAKTLKKLGDVLGVRASELMRDG
jgi:ribosome-binding protein aMBF1 (putative translation factor)